MKTKTYLFILFAFYSTQLSATSWFSFANKIPITKYVGQEIKLEAAVKVETIDEYSSARLWLRADRGVLGRGFLKNMWDNPIKNKEWNIYSIEGKIDEDALSVSFGALTEYSGNFYYDDFKLSIKNKQGAWELIYQMNFENGIESWKPGILNPSSPLLGTNNFFTVSIYDTKLKEHQNCLKIVGTNVPTYGHSKEAGKYAKVNGINLYYEIYGKGKPLVILHGNGGSISAILSLLLAKDYPKKVKKAIAYAANLTPDTLGLITMEYKRIEEEVNHPKSAKGKQLNTMMYKYPNVPFSDLHKIKADILVMSGDADNIPLEHTLKIYKSIERSNLCVLPAATHGGAWEKPELFQQLAIDFFEKPFKK